MEKQSIWISEGITLWAFNPHFQDPQFIKHISRASIRLPLDVDIDLYCPLGLVMLDILKGAPSWEFHFFLWDRPDRYKMENLVIRFYEPKIVYETIPDIIVGRPEGTKEVTVDTSFHFSNYYIHNVREFQKKFYTREGKEDSNAN